MEIQYLIYRAMRTHMLNLGIKKQDMDKSLGDMPEIVTKRMGGRWQKDSDHIAMKKEVIRYTKEIMKNREMCITNG